MIESLINPNPNAPLIVSDGMGVDSMAVLIALKNSGIRPDLIMFADTGGEKRQTYEYLAVQNEWLAKVGFPQVTVVSLNTKESTPYNDLIGNCHDNQTLPSLAFGGHSCSVKWKIKPQDYYVQGVNGPANKEPGWQPALDSWAKGINPVKVIGYDDSPADRKRAGKVHAKVSDKKLNDYQFWYPLQDLGWQRSDCIAAIQAEGLPVPVKSSCYFCPASKEWELWWLAGDDPERLLDAMRMEYNALTGRHSRWDTVEFGAWETHLATGDVFPTTKHCGLGRNFSWCKWAFDNQVVDLETWTVTITPKAAKAQATLLRGYDNAADVRGCGAVEAAEDAKPLRWVEAA